jgi:predicted RecB family nuclease
MVSGAWLQEHLQEVKRREEARHAALAARREEADRIFARLKAEKEAAMAAKEEQEFLINLLHQEENEAKQRAKEADRLAFEVSALCALFMVSSHGAALALSFVFVECRIRKIFPAIQECWACQGRPDVPSRAPPGLAVSGKT